jgi:hypothetical protein
MVVSSHVSGGTGWAGCGRIEGAHPWNFLSQKPFWFTGYHPHKLCPLSWGTWTSSWYIIVG